MSRSVFASLGALAVMCTVSSIHSTAAAQQSADIAAGTAEAVPLTPWGVPDLRGVWDYRTLTPLQRPRELAGRETLTEEEALAYERQQGDRLDDYDRLPTVHATWWLDYGRELTDDNRTALIVSPSDGRIPMSTADAKARAAVRAEARRVTAGAEDRGLSERCLTFGVPSLPGAYNNNLQILQTPTEVALVSEMIHDTRIIPLDAPDRLADNIRLWHGDARGRWEGSTLVVETTNFNRRGGWRGSTESLRLVERFTRVGPSAVQYELTVDAPDTWDEPWTAMVPFRKSDQTLFEYACHEGNRGLYNMLHNARWAEHAKTAGQGSR